MHTALWLFCSALSGEPLFHGQPLWAEVQDSAAEAKREPVRTTSGAREKDWILEVNGGGILLGDFDGEGSVDLLLVDGSTVERAVAGAPGEPPRVYLNDGSAGFRLGRGAWTLAPGRWGTGGALGDLNGDGHLDAVVTQWGPDRVFLNQLGAGFVERTEQAGLRSDGWSTSAALFDGDRDGHLDLYVVGYLEFDTARIPTRASRECQWKGQAVLCGPEGLVPTGDRWYRGLGDGRFEDRTEAAGIAAAAAGFGLGVVVVDVDQDGWLDVYVSNDSTPNHLWRNLGDGRFEEVGMEMGLALDTNGREQAGMGIAVGDADGDGLMDLFVTNFSGEHNAFYRASRRGARVRYADRAHQARLAGPSVPRLGWGTQMADFDHDGVLDLAVINGHVYPQADAPGTDTSYAQPPQWFRGLGGGRFEEQALWAGPDISGRAAAFADLDGDGDLDGLVIELDGPVWYLENRGARGPSLTVEPREASGGPAIGARVEVRVAGRTHFALVSTAGGYQAALPGVVHVGLGGQSAAELVRVHWPGGAVDEWTDVPAGRLVAKRTAEGQPEPDAGARGEGGGP